MVKNKQKKIEEKNMYIPWTKPLRDILGYVTSLMTCYGEAHTNNRVVGLG